MLLCIAVFWGVAAACGRDDYVRGDVLWEFLGPRTRLWVDRFGRVFVLLFFALLLWKVFEKVWDVRRTGETTSDTRTVLWPFLGLAWSATIVALSAVVAHFVISLHRSAPLQHDAAKLEEPRI
jgi:TRAP-type mannitol/chloroaromatic compound transport system permease small subunit